MLVANEFRAVEAIAGYSVDLSETDPLRGAIESLGLSESVFYDRLYVSLPNLETEIRSHLEESNSITFVMGKAGTGKTTIVRKVVRALQRALQSHPPGERTISPGCICILPDRIAWTRNTTRGEG